MDRRGLCLKHVQGADSVGIEIGALDRPLIARSDADIRYVDHLDTAGLRAKYQPDSSVNGEGIVDVGYVWSDGSLRQAVGPDIFFDFAVASHVVEHAPNLIQWLNDIHGVLKPGGRLLLVVPDKRFTFDIKRRCTEISDAIETYFAKRTRPSFGQIYDQFDLAATVDPATAWRDASIAATAPPVPGHGPQLALDMCRRSIDTGAYIDVHCSVFTPYSFIDLLRKLVDACPDVALPFRAIDFVPTPINDLEFFVALESLPVEPAEPYSKEVAQRLAREAGYAGEFGAGDFNAAIKADKDLRQRYDALTEAWKQSRGSQTWAATRVKILASLPNLDPSEHHAHPAQGMERDAG